MQASDSREDRKNQAVLGLFSKLEAPKEIKRVLPATKKLRLDFSSGDADSVQTALEDHVFCRVTAPCATYGVVYSTDLQDDHENTCHECGDVGQLIICDKPGCKFSFHLNCVGFGDVPVGDWFCKYCSANPIDPNDGHHVYCVECGTPGNLIMCDAENCPRSYHCSCVGLSDDVTIIEDWFCPSHPLEHPSGALLRILSWELELRHVAVGDARIQNKLQALVREIKKNDQLKIVTHFMNDAYSPDCATNSYLQELLKDEVVVAGVSLVSATMTVPDQVQQPTTYLELTKHRGTVGLRIDVNVTGQVNGTVYGSSIYSDDSDLNTAAVHAGVVKVGETKAVTVITKGPQKRFMGTSRNGVKTMLFSSWPGSFSFICGDAAAEDSR